MGRHILLLSLWVISFSASGCPCGCGAAGALGLFPGETWKFQWQLSRDYLGEVFEANGAKGREDGPTFSDTSQFTLASALGEDTSVFANIPVESNSHRGGHGNTALADPSFGAVWTALRRNFGTPYYPQIELATSYKFPQARTIQDEDLAPHLVNVHSNGWAEWSFQGDLSWEKDGVIGGGQHMLIHRFDKRISHLRADTQLSSPLGRRSSLRAGYIWLGTGQILASMTQEFFPEQRLNGQVVDQSSVQKNSVSLQGTLRIGIKSSYGVGYTRNGAFGENRNTPRSHTVAMSYAQAW